MSNDPNYDGSAEEAAYDEEMRKVEKAQLKSAAFDWFAQFMRRIDRAESYDQLQDVKRRIGMMPDLLLTYAKEPDIQF